MAASRAISSFLRSSCKPAKSNSPNRLCMSVRMMTGVSDFHSSLVSSRPKLSCVNLVASAILCLRSCSCLLASTNSRCAQVFTSRSPRISLRMSLTSPCRSEATPSTACLTVSKNWSALSPATTRVAPANTRTVWLALFLRTSAPAAASTA